MPDPHTGYNPGYNPPFPGAPLGPPLPMPPGSADTFPIPISSLSHERYFYYVQPSQASPRSTSLRVIYCQLPDIYYFMLWLFLQLSSIWSSPWPTTRKVNHCQLSDIVLVHVGFIFSYHHPSGPPPGPPPPG